jgi:hypothetical protein
VLNPALVNAGLNVLRLGPRQPLNLTLQPFEVVVMELRKAR